jgi:hypothetical protein
VSAILGETNTLCKLRYIRELISLPDAKGHLPGLVTSNPYLKHADISIAPELYDIPIGIVNRVLYGPKIKVIHGRTR